MCTILCLTNNRRLSGLMSKETGHGHVVSQPPINMCVIGTLGKGYGFDIGKEKGQWVFFPKKEARSRTVRRVCESTQNKSV